jgi:hypothetical protein
LLGSGSGIILASGAPPDPFNLLGQEKTYNQQKWLIFALIGH